MFSEKGASYVPAVRLEVFLRRSPCPTSLFSGTFGRYLKSREELEFEKLALPFITKPYVCTGIVSVIHVQILVHGAACAFVVAGHYAPQMHRSKNLTD